MQVHFNHDADPARQPSARCVPLCLPTNLDAIESCSGVANPSTVPSTLLRAGLRTGLVSRPTGAEQGSGELSRTVLLLRKVRFSAKNQHGAFQSQHLPQHLTRPGLHRRPHRRPQPFVSCPQGANQKHNPGLRPSVERHVFLAFPLAHVIAICCPPRSHRARLASFPDHISLRPDRRAHLLAHAPHRVSFRSPWHGQHLAFHRGERGQVMGCIPT